MNYTSAENYLLSLSNLPREEYMNSKPDKGDFLKRTQFFLDLIGNPEKNISHYIHVGGTSGKGSIVNFLHSILNEASIKIGSTISPHPSKLTQRWRIGNKTMTQKEFVKIIEFLKPKLDEYIKKSPYGMISFFEITTVIALLWFARKKVDWAILEVGCGGEFDATNIIPHKDIAVITNVELDHIEILGKTKIEIAKTKSKIIKSGCRVFTMEKDKKVLKVIERECRKNKVKLSNCQIVKLSKSKQVLSGIDFIYKDEKYSISILGMHQTQNAAPAIEIAQSLNIPEQVIRVGLKKTKQPLCMEIISKNPLIILDGAHNSNKMKTTVETTKQIVKLSNCQIVNLVLGFSDNKNISQMVRQLSVLKPASIACTRNTINPFRKVADPNRIAKLCKKYIPNAEIKIFLDPTDAFAWSRKKTKTRDLLLVTGSIFLNGDIKKNLDLN